MNYTCHYCKKECNSITSHQMEDSWWKCERCDVSYHVDEDGSSLLKINMFIRMPNKIYCLRKRYWNNSSALDVREIKYEPGKYEWKRIHEFQGIIPLTPQQFRDKLSTLLVFS